MSSRKPNALFALVQPDALLSEIVGSLPLSRPELTEKLWKYIKRYGLQDEKVKTRINADDALRAVFNGKSSVSMFEMTKHVSAHCKTTRNSEKRIVKKRERIPKSSAMARLLLNPPLVSFSKSGKEHVLNLVEEGRPANIQRAPVEIFLPEHESPAILVYEGVFDTLPFIARAFEKRGSETIILRQGGRTLSMKLTGFCAQHLCRKTNKLTAWAKSDY